MKKFILIILVAGFLCSCSHKNPNQANIMKFSYLSPAVDNITSSSDQDCAHCEDGLKSGTNDEFYSEKKFTVSSTYDLMYNHDYSFWSTYKSQGNSGLDIAYESFSLGYSNSNSSDQARYEGDRVSYHETRSINKSNYEKISKRLKSQLVYDSYKTCITGCYGRNAVFPSYTQNGNEVVISTELIINSNPTQRAVLNSAVLTTNLIPVLNPFKKGLTLLPWDTRSGKFRLKDSTKDASVNFSFTGFPTPSIQIIVKKLSKTNDSPIGAIMSSVLTYPQFCSLNGQDSFVNYADHDRCKWVPADGRSVIGSIYGTHINHVPDLRGVFLRGLNSFGHSADALPLVLEHADLKDDANDFNNREPNSFEGDVLKKHNHRIPPGAMSMGPGPHIQGQHNYMEEMAGRQSPIYTDPAGEGNETRPRNVAVFYYIKIN